MISDDAVSFFCCGENNGKCAPVKQDIFTVCFKGTYDDRTAYYDKRDLAHNSAVISQALAVIEKVHGESHDWSPWANG